MCYFMLTGGTGKDDVEIEQLKEYIHLKEEIECIAEKALDMMEGKVVDNVIPFPVQQ